MALSCSPLPEHAQCLFERTPSKPLSGGIQTIKLDIETSDVPGYGDQVGRSTGYGAVGGIAEAGWIIPFAALFGLAGRRTRYPLLRFLLMVAMAGLGSA